MVAYDFVQLPTFQTFPKIPVSSSSVFYPLTNFMLKARLPALDKMKRVQMVQSFAERNEVKFHYLRNISFHV